MGIPQSVIVQSQTCSQSLSQLYTGAVLRRQIMLLVDRITCVYNLPRDFM